MSSQDEFSERRRGTYVLVLHLPATAHLTVGRLGTFRFVCGWYAYVGSARSLGGLRGRLKHHLAPASRPHWHIDYLRLVAHCEEVWYSTGDAIDEHVWASRLRAMPGAQIPVPRFGASDCRCEAHLFYFAVYPRLADFRSANHRVDCDFRRFAFTIGCHIKEYRAVEDVG